MPGKHNLLKVFSIIVILAMMFSNIQPATAQGSGGDGLKRQVNAESGKVSFLGPESGRSVSALQALHTLLPPQDPAMALVQHFAPEFGVKNPKRDLVEMKSNRSQDGRLSVRYQQTYEGIPVMGGELIVNTDDGGNLYSMNGEASSELSLSTQPMIDAKEAKETALQSMAKWYQRDSKDFIVTEPALWIYDESLLEPSTRPAELVWRMEVTPKDISMPVRELVLVNAQRGNISLHFNQIDNAWAFSGKAGISQDSQSISTTPSSATLWPLKTSEPTPTSKETESSTIVPVLDSVKNEVASLTDAGTWYVATTGSDSNTCSTVNAPCATIKAAIAKASAGDLVRVASGTYTATGSTSNVVVFSKNMTLSGGWDSSFTVQNGVSIIDGSGLRNGILANAIGTVVVVESFIIQNSNTSYDGGGIDIFGANFTLKNSSVINNAARGGGAGIYITQNGALTVLNSTISGNKARYWGGGIYAESGTISINNSTIAYNNSNGTGGGIAIGSGAIAIRNSILARNTATGDGPDCAGSVYASAHNILGSTSGCAGMGGMGDQLDIDPEIDASLSGVIPFHALQLASPAIDAGDNNTCPAIDQRNMPRPQGSTCDIGAYESAEGGRLQVVSGSGQTTIAGSPFSSPLTVSLIDGSGNPISGVTITFTAPTSGANGTFADTDTNVTTAITDSNGQASSSIFTANMGRGLYGVSVTADGYSDVANFLLKNIAALFVATNGSDSNSCIEPSKPCLTINSAINKAVPEDKIIVAGGVYTGSGIEVVLINKTITLLGGWDDAFSTQNGTSVIDGGGARRGVTVTDASVVIDGFTIQNGYINVSGSGGGIQNSRGNLTLNNSIVTRNVSISMGGGIDNHGTLTINNTTIRDNRAGYDGGSGGAGGAGIYNGGTVVMNNSTISGNVLLGYFIANGIYNNGTFTLNNSTISGNVSGNIGRDTIYNFVGTLILNNSTVSNNGDIGIDNNNGTVILQNTVLAKNSTSMSGKDCAGIITSSGHNLIGNTTDCSFVSATGDKTNVDPMLNTSLVGAPAYHALLSSSPAIDAGDPNTCLPTDERGVTRPQGAACDIGAYEYIKSGVAASFGIADGNNQRTGASLPFPSPLRVYVVDDSGGPASGVDVTFTAPAFGPTGTFADTGTNITTVPVNAEGLGASPIFTANSQLGTYEVIATVSGLAGSVSFVLTNGTWFVSTTGNDGNSCTSPSDPCLTINAAIDKAANVDVIKVATGTYSYVSITKSLIISGGWDATFNSQTGYSIIESNATSQGIYSNAPDVSLSGFIVQNSKYGIYHNTGTLSFERGALVNNSNGIYNYAGDINLTNTTISGNNSGTDNGSAIMNNGGLVRIRYSTVADNTGSYAIYANDAQIDIGSSILAGNNGGDCYAFRTTNIASAGHNIFGKSPICSSSLSPVPTPTDQVGVDPKLLALSPLGYHPVPSTSPAIDHGDSASCPATDQRNTMRPQGGGCDVGAYEYTGPSLAASFGIASGSNQHSAPLLPFLMPFVVYVTDAYGSPVSGVDVTFTAPASGPSGSFADTQSNSTIAVSNESGLATSSVFTANSQPGTYNVTATVSGLSGSVNFGLVNAVWYVSTTGKDSNSCNVPTAPCLTFYAAIQKAASGDGILVAAGTYSPAQITKSVSILGGWDAAFASQTGYSTIEGDTRTDGITANASNVFIKRFVVRNSRFGISHTAGTLSFDQGALFNNNNGIYNFAPDTITTLTNTTVSGNHVGSWVGSDTGSAIKNIGGTVRIHYSTITGNTGEYAVYSANSTAYTEIGNSILAGNTGGDCYADNNSMLSAGHNILGNSPACSGPLGFVPDATDQIGVDPQLPVMFPIGYHPVPSTSPAVNHADPASCPPTDQRGMARPQGDSCDIGAYEYAMPGAAASVGIISGSDQHSGSTLPFPLPLTAYVIDASGNPVSGVNVTFTAPASGPSGTFADTGTNTTVVTTNDVGLATTSVFTANSQLGTYNVTATVPTLPGATSFTLVNATWFVSTSGSDGNSCNSPTSPCLTLDGAVGKAANGDSIEVATGIYPHTSIFKNLIILGGWDSTFSSQIGYSTVDGNFTSDGISVFGQRVNVSITRFVVQNSVFGINHSGNGTLSFDRGASINNNGGLYTNSGEVIFTNTTISDNHAGDTNGYVKAASAMLIAHGRVRVQYSTITNNGGMEAIWAPNMDSYLEIGNSILAGNPRGDCDAEAYNMTSLGHNIFGSSPICTIPMNPVMPHPTDQVGVDPKLSSLFINGYHPLMLGSPAIDAADPLNCPAIDQRGLRRPVGTGCDIGAFEYNSTTTTPKYIYAYDGSPQLIPVNTTASARLKVRVLDEDGDSVQGATVIFTAPEAGASIIFSNTGTNSSTAVTDANGFATSSAFSANNTSGMYFVTAAVNGVDTPASFALSNSTIVLNPKIQTYTANNFISLPGSFLCNQIKPGCTNGFDMHADAAHRYAIGTYSLYAIEHSRNSIDNTGMTIISSVRYSDAYANATWTGSQMVYGDTYDFPLADDVVAHELTHGVTQYESNLYYYYQSGAINESFSDLWGEYYDQINGEGNDTTSAKWLIGEDVSDLGAIRSMSNPPAYRDPDKMTSSYYYKDTDDNGGVHHNSGVNNKAVYLMVDGGTFNGETVSPLGWKKTAAIYYEVNTNLLTSGADYSDLYYALQQACTNLIGQKGISARDCLTVKYAADAVEMNAQPVSNFNMDAPLCDAGKSPNIVFADDLETGLSITENIFAGSLILPMVAMHILVIISCMPMTIQVR